MKQLLMTTESNNKYHEIINFIKNKKPNLIKLCYYPYVTKTNQITKINKTNITEISKILKKHTVITESNNDIVEYGYRDTFVKINNDQTNFYRKQIITCDTDNDGLFTIELINKCDENDLPFLANYPYYKKYHNKIYQLSSNKNKINLSMNIYEENKNEGIIMFFSEINDYSNLSENELKQFPSKCFN